MCDLADSVNNTEIDIGDYGDEVAPKFLHTHSLATCIGIGVLDHDTGRGYLIHDPSLAASGISEQFFKMLQNCSQNVSISVAGGDIQDDVSGETEVSKDRVYAISELRRIFPKASPKIFWNAPDQSYWMTVCPGSGQITQGLH
jgi:hypothetical protein